MAKQFIRLTDLGTNLHLDLGLRFGGLVVSFEERSGAPATVRLIGHKETVVLELDKNGKWRFTDREPSDPSQKVRP